MELRLENSQTRGTRILLGESAAMRRRIIDYLVRYASDWGYKEIFLPSIEPEGIYTDKAGPEILRQMYTFKDKADRDIVLRPEGTATCQLLARGPLKKMKDLKVFYETRCWRYEKPQAGRYREFTQFGVEILNPTYNYIDELQGMSADMVKMFAPEATLNRVVKRGLAYYIEEGWEVEIPSLGAQKQVAGGGRYEEGIGFAIGVDRLMLAVKDKNEAYPLV